MSFVVSNKGTKTEMHLEEADMLGVWNAFVLLIKQKEAIDIICKEEYLTLFFLRGEAV